MIAHLYPLIAPLPPAQGQVISAALAGDPVAMLAALDIVEEGGWTVNPFEIGKAYYIETLTLYYIGRVVEVHPTYVKLDRASWIHWTGRKSILFQHKSFAKEHFVDCRAPRTEYVGGINVSLAGLNAWEEWPVEQLPEVSIQ